jgi:hypothetical protein
MMVLLSALLLLAAVLTGCAPRIGAGEAAAVAGPDDVVIDLPSIAIDVADDGSISLAGIALGDLTGSLGAPIDLAIPADLLQQLTGLGVQHLQIANQVNGLGVYINGLEIPSIAWTPDSLATLGSLTGDQPALGRLLPLLTNLGVGVTLNLPVPAGAERMPLAVATEASGADELENAQQSFLAGVQNPPQITIPVKYNADGSWTVAGVSGDQWIAITGQDFWENFNLTPEQVSGAMAAGIQNFELQVDSQGVSLMINDNKLPYVDWSGGKLASVIDLLQQAGMLDSLPIESGMLQTLLDTLLPIVTSSDVSIVATFPAP